jgi:ribosome-associated toxin RatA of RatAB toxin-antitoxin module
VGQRVNNQVDIAAPAATIWDIILDLETYPQWVHDMEKVVVERRDDQGRPLDARFQVDARVVKVHYTLRYVYGDERLDWHLVEGEMLSQLDGTYVLTERDGATHVDYTIEADLNMPLPGFLKKRAAKTILDTGLKGLKERAEARA